jgi:hypothetical protein
MNGHAYGLWRKNTLSFPEYLQNHMSYTPTKFLPNMEKLVGHRIDITLTLA